MNQPLRPSEFAGGEPVPRPSAKFQVPLVETGAFACKFIIGDADENAVCCGAPTDGRSWCAYHRRIVFDPSKGGRVR
jgi:hypothetical protein